MANKSNIDVDFNQLSVNSNNVNNVVESLNRITNFIDTTIDDFTNLKPEQNRIRINGKYPERNYIIFDVQPLSTLTAYSSNIYTPSYTPEVTSTPQFTTTP